MRVIPERPQRFRRVSPITVKTTRIVATAFIVPAIAGVGEPGTGHGVVMIAKPWLSERLGQCALVVIAPRATIAFGSAMEIMQMRNQLRHTESPVCMQRQFVGKAHCNRLAVACTNAGPRQLAQETPDHIRSIGRMPDVIVSLD